MLSGTVWSITFRMIAKYPRILLPFLVKAVFEALVLAALFYSPRPPFSAIFAKPISSFFGANSVHYPYNFTVLPTLFYYGQIFVMVGVGVVMYGMAMGMVSQAHSGSEDVKIFGNFNRAVRRYFALFGVWILTFIISLIIIKTPSLVIPHLMQKSPSAVTLLKALSYAGVAVVFVMEALFVYAYPAIIIERKSILGAIKRSFGVIRHVFLPTIILVFIPRLAELLYMFVRGKQQGLMNLTCPEITLVILGAGIVLTFITDSLVYLSTANLFILKQETEKGA